MPRTAAILAMCRGAFRIVGALLVSSFLATSALGTRSRVEARTYVPVKTLWNETWTDWLKRDLLLEYDKFARPAQHYNTTRVTIDLTVRHVVLDELKSTMTVHAWVKMIWIDEKLKWNASNYGGLRELHLGDHEVWQPDIVLYNSAAGSIVDHYGNTHCIAHEDGTVMWVPPSQFHVFCDLDLRMWPFDTQICSLRLGSWAFNGEEIDLQLIEPEKEPPLMIQNSEWKLLGVARARNVVYYVCCPEAYIDVTFNLTLKRDSPIYYAVVVSPAATIVILTLVTFWLSPQSEERITVAGCTALMIIIFLIYFSFKVPAVAYHAPLLICFYGGCLYQVTISMFLSIVVVNISRRPSCKPLPRVVKQLLLGQVGKYLGLGDLVRLIQFRSTTSGQELRESHAGDTINSSSSSTNCFDDGDRQNIIPPPKTAQLEWILAATAIDRISFLFFCFVFFILMIACIV